MPEEIIGENKFEYLVSVEISLESTCAFVLKHLDTEYVIVNITYFLWRVSSAIQGDLYLVVVKWLALCCV